MLTIYLHKLSISYLAVFESHFCSADQKYNMYFAN